MCEKKLTDLEESSMCPECEQSLSEHAQLSIGVGVYIGNGVELGHHIIKKVYKRDVFYSHPFFYTAGLDSPDAEVKAQAIANVSKSEKNTRRGIEAHHLICSAAVNKTKYRRIIYLLGYSINHHKNGVLLPTIMKVACSYKVPLHRGGHDIAFVMDNKKEQKIVVSVFDADQELKDLNYVKRVKKIVLKIMIKIDLNDVCYDIERRRETAKNFINDMDRQSQKIFLKLRTFQWAISSDGFDYQRGGVGCFGCITLKEKRKALKTAFQLDYKLSDKVQSIQASIYNNKEKLREIYKVGRCLAPHYENPLKVGDYFKEREAGYIKPLEKID